jgi:hypothetical protein
MMIVAAAHGSDDSIRSKIKEQRQEACAVHYVKLPALAG